MKRVLFFFCFLLCFILLVIPAFASDVATGEESSDSESTTSAVPETEDLGEYIGSTVYALNPITASDSSGLKAVLLQFVGEWDSIVIEHAYESSSGDTSYVREVQLDYPWLCSAGFLVVVIFCLFRLGGSILCKT